MELNYEQWFEKYKPIPNPFNEDKNNYQIHWNTIEENDLLKYHIGGGQVWTVVKSKKDSIILKSGFRRENRLYHYITQIPYVEDIEIVLDEGYPEINEEDLKNLESVKRYMQSRDNPELLTSLSKIIEYCKRTNF